MSEISHLPPEDPKEGKYWAENTNSNREDCQRQQLGSLKRLVRLISGKNDYSKEGTGEMAH